MTTTSTRTLYIPHYQVLDGLPHPPPQWVFQLFEEYGLGDVQRVDIAPRNTQTESAEWANNGVNTETDFMAFIHIDASTSHNDVLEIVDDPSTTFQLDWGEEIHADTGTNFGSGYWIVLPSTSSGALTHAAASYHPIEGGLSEGIVTLRKEGGVSSPPMTMRSLITDPYATGYNIVIPSTQNHGLYRYDLLNGAYNPLHPYADGNGHVAYTESEFVTQYGSEHGYARFRDAPDAATLQISMPHCGVNITTLFSNVPDLLYHDLNDMIDLATPILNSLISMASQGQYVGTPPHACVTAIMDPPRGYQILDHDAETGTAVFDVHIVVSECPIIIAHGLGQTIAVINALIRSYTNGSDHISFCIPGEIPNEQSHS